MKVCDMSYNDEQIINLNFKLNLRNAYIRLNHSSPRHYNHDQVKYIKDSIPYIEYKIQNLSKEGELK